MAEKSNMSASDQEIFKEVGNMAQSADTMAKLENRKGFDPTTITYAMSQYWQNKGMPASLSKDEAEYMSAYARYFTYLRKSVTGAAASVNEEKRIDNIVGADKTKQMESVRNFQKVRGDIVNISANALNPEGKLRLMNIPEARQFMKNKGAIQEKSLRGK